MKKTYCMNCVRPREDTEKVCPVCGNVHGQESPAKNALKNGTILGGRYLLGGVREKDEWCITYYAMDLAEEKSVSIKEFFPADCAVRNAQTVQWQGDREKIQQIFQRFGLIISRSPQSASVIGWISENATQYCILKCAQSAPAAPAPAPVKQTTPAPVKQTTPAPAKQTAPAPVKQTAPAPAKQTAPAPVKQTAPESAEKKPASAVKKYVLPIVAAAVIALILAWCAIQHFWGNQNMENGNYAAAVSAFRKDFLFGGARHKEAARRGGEEAFAGGEYALAAEYFAMLGQEGADRWTDAVLEQAKQLIRQKEPEQALELLKSLEPEERVSAQIGVAQLEIAKQLYKDKRTAEAIAQAESIEDTTIADVTGFLNTVHQETAEAYVHSGELEKAIAEYRKCVGVASAETDAEVLELLKNGKFTAAAYKADAGIDEENTGFERSQWEQIFADNMGELTGSSGIDESLDYTTAKAILSERSWSEDSMKTGMELHFNETPAVGRFYNTPGSTVVVDDMDALYSSCGTAPAGKILIVQKTHAFSPKTASYAVDISAMEKLPIEYRPASLAEVEYIVLVTYDFTRQGSYTKGTIAIREKGQVEVFQMPAKKRIGSPKTKTGATPPNSFSYYGYPPEWKSGGAPNMGGDVCSAILKIIK